MKGVDSAIKIPTSLSKFFLLWCHFLKPLHKLTDREIEVVAAFLEYRYELSKSITDEGILDMITMNLESKTKIKEKCNLKTPHFQVIMGNLKKNKVIVDNKLNPKFIPHLTDSDNFNFLLMFEIHDKATDISKIKENVG